MMKHPNPLMLVRIAQGDAYCVATEYLKFPRDQRIHDEAIKFERYGKHPTHSLRPGQYSDDTQMSIGVAEVLLDPVVTVPRDPSTVGYPLVEHATQLRARFAESFVRCFHRDPRDGYARGFQAFLEKTTTGAEFLANIQPDSDKNGACMRAVPIGVLPTTAAVEYVAAEQAKITHDTPGGRGSAMIVALLSHFALYYDEPLSQAPEFVAGHFHTRFEPWAGGPVKTPDVGMRTARAVMTLLATETSLLGIARKTIEWGGDTDSVLAIAWGIASTRMREDLPPFFEGGLENGTYGRNFLHDLGERLTKRYCI